MQQVQEQRRSGGGGEVRFSQMMPYNRIRAKDGKRDAVPEEETDEIAC